MKTLFSKLSLFVVATLWLGACQKDEEQAILNSAGSVPVVTLSSNNVVLTKDNADKDALTVSWANPNYGFKAGVNYTILIDKKGGDFSKGISVSTGTDLKKTFKVSELNPMLIKLGLAPGTAADLDVRVSSLLGVATTFNSATVAMKVTPYLDKLDLSSNWGVVGSGFNNWGATPDAPFYKTDKANVFAAYVALVDGEIKFRQDNKWDVNYGGTNGTIALNGANIAVKAGMYKITLDIASLKYTIEKYSWGVVGSAYNNWGATPDYPFFYDPSSDQFRAIVALKDGEMKIRLNNDWGTNYGGTAGALKLGGDNIAVKAGTYLITMNLNKQTYTVEAYKVWGVVGSGTPNGWNGPDAKFTPDFGNDGIWYLRDVKLTADEIKFRQNDDWAVNYGDDGADGIMELNGANIKVKAAGTYDITLDFSTAGKPKYTLTKK